MPWKHGEIPQLLRQSTLLLQDPIGLAIRVVSGSPEPSFRLVIIVPRTVGSAPVRNRCRRRLRALVQKSALSAQPIVLFVLVRKSIAQTAYPVLQNIMQKAETRFSSRVAPMPPASP